jgi:hypothetical protein
MQNDILPPGGGDKTKIADRQPMRSLRLRGHSLDNARERLMSGPLLGRSLPNMEKQAVEVLPPHVFQDTPPSRFSWWHNWNRRQKIGVITLTLLLVVASGVFWTVFKKPAPPKNTGLQVQAATKPTTVASPLTGLQVAPELAQRPVTGIMIENSTDARPQSGLQDAGVVFEAIAEGGITRFIAMFQDSQPQYVGPVRSLRPYYIDFAASFDASIAHIGGSPAALAQIRGGGKDLDQFFNAGSYWRQPSRRTPHNVYTSFERLDALNKAKGYTSSKFTTWLRKVDKKLVTPTAKTINVNISSALYNSHYDYDAVSNTYLRSEGGKAHNVTNAAADSAGQQLHPKVVLVLVMTYGIAPDGKHSQYGATGNGTVFVFQDGGVTQGTWTKADRGSQFSFTDVKGKPIRLDAGQAWVTVVARADMVNYAP